ncbi:MAG: gamma-glutamyltransferase [Moraxellaceae bacterium]|jgi:gamma-glutamyltranspeptidase/glutathione hydrolase|nr:gamma-glutamyltransferase [Moraxellaceae bacterium]
MKHCPSVLLLLALCSAPSLALDSAPAGPAATAPAPPAGKGAPAAPEGDTGRYPLSAARASQAMAVTANPYATDAALAILRQGGNAIDAAIAAQAVLGLVEPQSSGFGGGAFIVYHDGKQTQSFDGRETAPAAATPDRFLDKDGQPLAFHAAVASGRGIGIPGVVAALYEAHKRHGRLHWRQLFTPAIQLARQGFPVSPRLHALIARDPLLRTKSATRQYFFNAEGEPWPVGHLLKNPDYAHTLERLARFGVIGFYTSRETRALIAELQREGADFTPADWRNYRARISPALCAPYREWTVCTAPPPAGGWTVLQTLRLLEGFRYEGNLPLHLHRLLEAERLSFADRQRYSADPAFVPVPLTALLHEDYIAGRRELIGEQSMKTASAGTPPGLMPPWGQDGQLLENGTTHLVIADRYGHWLSMTSSIEDAFGSRLMAGGMLFNNQLTDFSFSPQENGRPLANDIVPGKRPRSAMSPVIVLDRHGAPLLALGSPGGSRIIGYVLRALVASLDEKLPPAEAVSAPLVLSRNGPTEIDADFPPALRAALEARGHPFSLADLNSGIALVQRRQEATQGAADPRREGRAAGY